MRRDIPVLPLTDYAPPGLAERGIFVGRFEASVNRLPCRLRTHRHHHFELFWLEGRGTHVNDFVEHPLSGRSFVVVSPGQVHGWEEHDGLRGTMVGFTAEFFDGREPPPSALLAYPFVHGSGGPPALAEVEAGTAAELDRVAAALEDEYRRQGPDWSGALRAWLRLAFVHGARAQVRRAPGDPRGGDLVRRFRLELETHFRTTTSVAGFARRLGVTAGHLNDAIRAGTGRTAGELIRERVLLEGRRLLLHSELSVSEIAYRLGFDDPSYFARFFRRELAQAPGEYRAAIREKYRSNAA
jgi:AraC family transcriptional regulator, transcriptional activator of pobA